MSSIQDNLNADRGWTYRFESGVYILSIGDQQSLTRSIHDFMEVNDIQAGSVSGIGAVKQATLRFFIPESQQYEDRTFDEQMELAALNGDIALIEGKATAHLHATFGRQDYTALAGHLLDARIRGACELFVQPIPAKLEKKPDPSIGLNLYDFDNQ